MVYEEMIRGVYVNMHSVLPEDAGVTLKMRLDPQKAKYLHPIENDLKKQENWIKNQNMEEGDYYFLAKDKNGQAIGTFGIYNLDLNEGESGRLIVYGNPLQSIEINLLLFRFAFEYLKISQIKGVVDENNRSAIRINLLFGFELDEAIRDCEMNRMIHNCRLKRDIFYSELKNINKMLYKGKMIPKMPWEE